MFGLTALELARAQFAFTVSFHFIFPSFSIGLASFLAVLNGLWLWTRNETYLRLFKYWKAIFAVAFAMGVVSGIVMSYQFGTNWSVYADKTGPVLGPLMAYEVLSAFFLEAGFLGIMLFGRERVGERLHFIATCVVALGTAFSAFWILSVNSWMQTPAGFATNAQGQFVPVDWWAIVFNPSFPYRLVHTVLAAYLTTAFVVGGVGAFHLLRDRKDSAARKMFSMAMWMALIVAPLQILAGDTQGLNTLQYQPAKIAALEGHYETEKGAAGLVLFGLPDDADQVMHDKVEIPHLGSVILTHSWDGHVPGLDQFPRENRPPVEIVFWSFRVMVAIGMLMALVGLWSGLRRWQGRLYDDHWLQRLAVLMSPAGFVAVIAGWVTTEVGRQPFTVYGHLRTADSVSPILATTVGPSLIAFVVVYFVVFGFGVFYILRLMARSPAAGEGPDPHHPIRTAGITPGPTQSLGADVPAE